MRDKLIALVESYPNHYGRMIKGKDYKQVLAYVEEFPGKELKEKVYIAIHGEVEHLCANCRIETEFISLQKGYRKYCSARCQSAHGKDDRLDNAIKKLNDFGNLEYISGYDGSHSKVTVKNTSCGCTFEATYLNLFTNPNYCPTHGVIDRTNKLIETMKNGLTPESIAQRKETFDKMRAEKLQSVARENQEIEDEVISSDFTAEFLDELNKQSRSNTEKILSRFPKLLQIVNDQYGERFGQKLYNCINNINSLDDVPKCVECKGPVNFQTYANRYNNFCSQPCRYANKELLLKTWESQLRLKDFTLPSGRVIQLMGYEPQVLRDLLSKGFTEDEFEFDTIPVFRYGRRFYFPDFYVPTRNLIIEVKSTYTFEVDKENNMLKKQAVEDKGYNFSFIIWSEQRDDSN